MPDFRTGKQVLKQLVPVPLEMDLVNTIQLWISLYWKCLVFHKGCLCDLSHTSLGLLLNAGTESSLYLWNDFYKWPSCGKCWMHFQLLKIPVETLMAFILFHIAVGIFACLQVESRTRPVSQQHPGNSCPLESGNTIRLAENTIRLSSCRALQMEVQ